MRPGIVAALLLLVPLSAAAQDAGFGPTYAGLRGSLALSTSVKTTVPTTPPSAIRASFNTGGGGSLYIGTRLPYGFRVELEGLYRHMPLGSAALNGSAIAVNGYGEMAAPMVNLFWNAPVDFPVHPFLGAGIGEAWTETSLHGGAGATLTTYLHSNSWRLAYEAMAGLEIPVNPSSRIDVMYRWLHMNDGFHCGTSGAPTATCKADFSDQSIDLGLEMDL